MKSSPSLFLDCDLVVKLFSLLNAYKFKQSLRKYIFSLLEGFFSNPDLHEKLEMKIKSIDKNIF